MHFMLFNYKYTNSYYNIGTELMQNFLCIVYFVDFMVTQGFFRQRQGAAQTATPCHLDIECGITRL